MQVRHNPREWPLLRVNLDPGPVVKGFAVSPYLRRPIIGTIGVMVNVPNTRTSMVVVRCSVVVVQEPGRRLTCGLRQGQRLRGHGRVEPRKRHVAVTKVEAAVVRGLYIIRPHVGNLTRVAPSVKLI
jgi:hypothetical protein